MQHHLNTLYITTDGAALRREGEAVAVFVNREQRLRVPLHNLGSIVCFGGVSVSPPLMAAAAEAGVAITFLKATGRFLARVSGFTPGNVLLRRTQYRLADDPAAALEIAKHFVLGKIANTRSVVIRAARDRPDTPAAERLRETAHVLAREIPDVNTAANLDILRGLEGDASRHYFAAFNHLITNPNPAFAFGGRSRRPPLDVTNALLSFLYALLTHDARAACEACGLDPAVGYLHADRPGRPSLALDLIEEFRAFLADRVALALINRQQLKPRDFTTGPTGGVSLQDDARKTVLTAYQKRKQEKIMHPFLNETTTIGLLIHLQARLLARFIRGELDAYPPFFAK